MAIGFMSFGGMLTGGDEEAKPAAAPEVVIEKVQEKVEKEVIAKNTKRIQ
jgi:Na+-transporting NADH:ubiquinone oxidoreductase subunit E